MKKKKAYKLPKTFTDDKNRELIIRCIRLTTNPEVMRELLFSGIVEAKNKEETKNVRY